MRVDKAQRLKHDKAQRKVIKGSPWLLLRNRENVKPKDRVKLRELLQANRRLMTVYVLKDDLKHLWDYRYMRTAVHFWEQWRRRAIRSRIEPLKKFARNLNERIAGVIAHCHWPLHTSLLEGINNKIKLSFRTSREGFPRFWHPDFAEVEAVWQLWVVGATPWQGLVALRAFAALTSQATDFTAAGLC